MRRLQIYYPEELLRTLRLYAKTRGIPLAEAIREGSREFVAKREIQKIVADIPGRKTSGRKREHPILAMAGIIKGGPTNASTTVDDIYDDP